MFLSLWDEVESLKEEIAGLKKNSSNSSKPPSSDHHNPNRPAKGKKKGKGKRKPGGQAGHKGHTLLPVKDPDHIIKLKLEGACGCGHDLGEVEPEGYENRQVFDLPEQIRVQTTEYKAAYGTCPCCGKKARAQFPGHVKAPVQYGPHIRTLVTYLHAYQLLPCERIGELCGDLFNCKLSSATVSNILESAGDNAAPVALSLKEQIRNAPYIHLDETSLRLGRKNYWLYTASTPTQTYFYLHPNRSREALSQFGILEGYRGFAIHDFYSIYLPYDQCNHGLCNAHHLRDLKYVEEELGQPWAGELSEFLVRVKRLKEELRAGGSGLDPGQLSGLRKEYFQILLKGERVNPEPMSQPGQRGRPKRGKALNLLDRLVHREDEVLAFLYNDVPFDNNQAERDLRMMKVKQKISGCFRSEVHAGAFINIRSVIASAKKQAVNIFGIIKGVIQNPDEVISQLVPS